MQTDEQYKSDEEERLQKLYDYKILESEQE